MIEILLFNLYLFFYVHKMMNSIISERHANKFRFYAYSKEKKIPICVVKFVTCKLVDDKACCSTRPPTDGCSPVQNEADYVFFVERMRPINIIE